MENHISSHHKKVTKCTKCDIEGSADNELLNHDKNKHLVPQKQIKNFQRKSRTSPLSNEMQQRGENKRNSRQFAKQLCIHWNHGYCRFGDLCKYIHEEIPACNLQ